MLQTLYKYLILNKKAGIPGIGVFRIERKPAHLDFANKVFVSPSLQIAFTEGLAVADKRFYSFISKEQQVEETEAIKGFSNFSYNLKESLNTNSEVLLPGLGSLTRNASGALDFQPADQISNYFPGAVAERIIRKEEKHDVLVGDTHRTNTEMQEILSVSSAQFSHKKDHWWIFAIILGLIAITAIVYYYVQNGSLR